MKTVVIAFSGGVESMYLAQMYIEQGYSVELLHGCINGRAAEVYEASLIYRAYEQLQKLYPQARIMLSYSPKGFFSTHCGDDHALMLNQQFRTACLLTNMQSKRFRSGVIYVAGWLKEDAYETSLCFADYTEKQYDELKHYPITVNPLSRLSVHPVPIITPLWDLTKRIVYERINPGLRDYLVLNMIGPNVSSAKIEEYKMADIPLPNYLNNWDENRQLFVNDYGRCFADSDKFSYAKPSDLQHPEEFLLSKFLNLNAYLKNKTVVDSDTLLQEYKKCTELHERICVAIDYYDKNHPQTTPENTPDNLTTADDTNG